MSREGVYVGKTPKLGAEALVENHSASLTGQLILIGTVSAFRPFDKRSIEEYYSSYTEFSALVHPGSAPAIGFGEFRKSFSGWTNLKYFTVPAVTGFYEDALVPVGLTEQIKFPSSLGIVMVQEAGDLLAARTNADGFYVVESVLCKDGSAYVECAKQYKKGIFDGATGAQLYRNLERMPHGYVIDTKTFELL
jgi:hypothetical protein